MAVLSLAELNNRHRFLLYFLGEGKGLGEREVGTPTELPINRINFSRRYALDLESMGLEYATEQNLVDFTLRLLRRREVVIAEYVEPTLALFNDDERTVVWTRLFSEVIDVQGILIAVLRTGSLLAPPRRIADRFSSSIRGNRGALASDEQLLREVTEG